MLVVLLVGGVVRRLRIAAGMRKGDQAVIDAKRQRNKRFANKMVTAVGRAGRPHSIFAIIDVTGRRTGRRYTTPVRAIEQPTDFVVPLTYGPKTSWFVNLQHNPGTLRWQGRSIPVGDPVWFPRALWPAYCRHPRGSFSGSTEPTSAYAFKSSSRPKGPPAAGVPIILIRTRNKSRQLVAVPRAVMMTVSCSECISQSRCHHRLRHFAATTAARVGGLPWNSPLTARITWNPSNLVRQ
jgi:hypothetical protein